MKVTALASVVGAAVTDASLVVWSALQSTPVTAGDLGAGGLAGGATAVAVLWAWKGMTDKRLDKLEESKADKDMMEQHAALLDEVRLDIKKLLARRDSE